MASETQTQETVVPRLAVRRFAEEMERALCWNDHKESWRNLSFAELLAKLAEEVGEVAHAYRDGGLLELENECADVACVALMIWDSQAQMQRGDTDGRGREYPPDPDADEQSHEPTP